MVGYFSTRQGAATLSLISNTTLILLKIVVGLLTNSVSIISEAIHSSVDLLAAIIAFFSIRAASRPADQTHHFGHGKWESLSAAVEAILIFVGAGLIIFEAGRRLYFGAGIDNIDHGIAVMAFSSGVNWLVSRRLFRVARALRSPALEADGWHLATDVYTGAGVGVGLLLVRLTGLNALDPLIAIGVAFYIVRAAWGITRRSVGDLLDASMPEPEEARIRAILDAHKGLYSNVRLIRTRGGTTPHMEIALEFPPNVSLPEAHALTEHLEEEMRRAFPGAVAVVEAEPIPVTVDSPETVVAAVRQVASRIGAPVHHISAHANDHRFTVNLHLEVDSALSLQKAHELATQVEQEIQREIPQVSSVTTHIEPAENEALQADAHSFDPVALEKQIEAVARELPQVKDVHDVQVQRRNNQLYVSLHCMLDGALPIGQAHWISGEIEVRLKQKMPAIASVFVHTEPQAKG